MNKFITYCLLPVILLITVSSCGSGDKPLPEGDTLTRSSSLLTIIDHGSYLSATINDPWNKNKTLGRYYLVPRDNDAGDLPDDGIIIKTPINSAAVFSTVHISAIDELGHFPTIKATADGNYCSNPNVLQAIKNGSITDVGPSTSPSIEQLVDIAPEVALVSPFQNSDHSAISKTGITVIPMADYMETTPLGRAEWILFIGALYNDLDKAREIYSRVSADYSRLARQAAQSSFHPLVLTETPVSGVWYCPGGNSYAANLIKDAGGRVIFHDNKDAGSIQADCSTVYDRAAQADVWLIRSFGPLDKKTLNQASPLISKMKPFANNLIYICNSSTSPIFDDTTFHPELILAEYIKIFSNPSQPTLPLRYFTKMN